MTHKYKIEEEHKDPMSIVILKQGIETTFTPGDLKVAYNQAIKAKDEVDAQLLIDKAQLQNVIDNNKDLFEEKDGSMQPKASEKEMKQAVALSLFNGITNKINETNGRLEEFTTTFGEFTDELADIEKQTGLELKIIESDVK